MTEPEGPSSPQAAITEATSERAADAFAILGNETRLAILLTLWDAHEPFADENNVSFSTLRRRVGMTDSGQFNYHLDKLTGEFIDATDEGYSLKEAGHNIIRAVVSGVGVEPPTLNTAELEFPCPRCESPLDIAYDDRTLTATCATCAPPTDTDEEDKAKVLMEVGFPPGGVGERTAAETLMANGIQETWKHGMRLSGVCPECAGVVESSFTICENHSDDADHACPRCNSFKPIKVHFVCTVCKAPMKAPPEVAAGGHPEAIAFMNDQGFPLGIRAGETVEFHEVIEKQGKVDQSQELLSNDPLRVKSTLSYESEWISIVFNDAVDVVKVERGTDESQP